MEEIVMFYVLVENGTAFSAINYLPDLPAGIEIYPVSMEEYENFGKDEYEFNYETKHVILKSDNDRLALSWDELRDKRNNLLRLTDWTALSDADLTDEQQTKWRAYRQELRNFPSQVSDPADPNLNWPQRPYEL